MKFWILLPGLALVCLCLASPVPLGDDRETDLPTNELLHSHEKRHMAIKALVKAIVYSFRTVARIFTSMSGSKAVGAMAASFWGIQGSGMITRAVGTSVASSIARYGAIVRAASKYAAANAAAAAKSAGSAAAAGASGAAKSAGKALATGPAGVVAANVAVGVGAGGVANYIAGLSPEAAKAATQAAGEAAMPSIAEWHALVTAKRCAKVGWDMKDANMTHWLHEHYITNGTDWKPVPWKPTSWKNTIFKSTSEGLMPMTRNGTHDKPITWNGTSWNPPTSSWEPTNWRPITWNGTHWNPTTGRIRRLDTKQPSNCISFWPET